MTINERVSDERLNELAEGVSGFNLRTSTHEESMAIARELQQYRAAAEKPIGSFHIIDQQVDGTTDYVKDGEWPIDNGELLVYAAPQVTSVQEEYAIKASGISDVLKDAADYAPLTAGQWHTLVKNWHQTFCGLAEGVAAPAVQAEQLSGNAEQVTKCWCHTCRPVTMTDMRFVVCPDCGNKRCPHANDHRNACTGSNEPGQEGSAYPAAPKQEAE